MCDCWDEEDEISTPSSRFDYSQSRVPNKVNFGRNQRRNYNRIDDRQNNDKDFAGGSDNLFDDATTITVDSRDCGKIIGKGGSVIRELEQKSGARIKVCQRDRSETDVPVVISGSQDARNAAHEMINDLMNLNLNRRQPRERDTGSNEMIKIAIRKNDCGKLIGRGGSTINDIRDKSNTYIKVCQDDEYNYEVPVEITGTSEDCKLAKKLIQDLLEDRENYKPQNSKL